jgi:crotonobetainyl-CoA:carnitine CoA-transferase CaiB-like acyl-CoA transferase
VQVDQRVDPVERERRQDKHWPILWDEWEERIRTYELIACRVNALTDLHEDEQVLANRYLVNLPHPDLGTWWYVPTPIHYSKTPINIRSAAPAVGADTDEILAGLSYSDGAIADLRARHVV